MRIRWFNMLFAPNSGTTKSAKCNKIRPDFGPMGRTSTERKFGQSRPGSFPSRGEIQTRSHECARIRPDERRRRAKLGREDAQSWPRYGPNLATLGPQIHPAKAKNMPIPNMGRGVRQNWTGAVRLGASSVMVGPGIDQVQDYLVCVCFLSCFV